ncbi:branched-chain amino acid aminotransferase [Jeongeupia naejangsanensis]|uniref:branched-chain-amino-acid transaminase n=1 Tax=Jeongeupia naejangsanensis TaxID=613195 RepID=A0ABS2BQJ9_9NEIS|nr:branched-chain amino acid aminotransferase [Jeongeupia naejangsanensis]MBM3117909.1 branched-chain amino acid aminotransferase [Jeongeupia naejangsanensis]
MHSLIWSDGQWSSGTKLIGAGDHAFWMGSTVFDGARAIHGQLPDLHAHCERAINSAVTMGMQPRGGRDDIVRLVHEGLAQLPVAHDYYIKVLFYCPGGFLLPDPATTTLALHLFEAPLPADTGFSATFSDYRRPAPSMAPTDAKASCLYPNTQRAMRDAAQQGFDNAIMLDPDGAIAEFAVANLWLVRDGVAKTPVVNGTFLNGITRQRVIRLLRDDGIQVVETTLWPEDLLVADEVFSTGNYGKVLHCLRVDAQPFAHGPVARRARELYLQFSAAGPR